MARIKMMETITGGRYDGRPWPPMNEPFHVPDWEARELVAAKHAVYEDDPVLAEPLPSADVPKFATGGVVSAPSSDFGGEAEAGAVTPGLAGEATAAPVTAAADEADGDDDNDVMRPAVNQPKAAWVTYAVSQGADPQAAEAMTKADLMSEYGSRL